MLNLRFQRETQGNLAVVPDFNANRTTIGQRWPPSDGAARTRGNGIRSLGISMPAHSMVCAYRRAAHGKLNTGVFQSAPHSPCHYFPDPRDPHCVRTLVPRKLMRSLMFSRPSFFGTPRLLAFLAWAALGLSGCATKPPADDPDAVADYQQTNDPLEPTNRVFYAINNGLDTVLLRPAALAYRYAVPSQHRLARAIDQRCPGGQAPPRR
jgi:hypothetical protein